MAFVNSKVDIIALRHSLKGEDGLLNPEGKTLAAEVWGQIGAPKPQLGIRSGFERTEQTKIAMVGQVPTVQVDELFFDLSGHEGKLIKDAFAAIGIAGLQEYRAKVNDETWSAFVSAGQEAWAILLEQIKASKAANILIIGHGVMLDFIILAAIPEAFNEIGNAGLLECEGAQLFLSETGVYACKALRRSDN